MERDGATHAPNLDSSHDVYDPLYLASIYDEFPNLALPPPPPELGSYVPASAVDHSLRLPAPMELVDAPSRVPDEYRSSLCDDLQAELKRSSEARHRRDLQSHVTRGTINRYVQVATLAQENPSKYAARRAHTRDITGCKWYRKAVVGTPRERSLSADQRAVLFANLNWLCMSVRYLEGISGHFVTEQAVAGNLEYPRGVRFCIQLAPPERGAYSQLTDLDAVRAERGRRMAKLVAQNSRKTPVERELWVARSMEETAIKTVHAAVSNSVEFRAEPDAQRRCLLLRRRTRDILQCRHNMGVSLLAVINRLSAELRVPRVVAAEGTLKLV